MNNRPLLLSPETEALARRVREYAEKPENWFRPGALDQWGRLEGSGRRPGDKPEHQVTIPHEFHCIFSWTVAQTLDGKPVVVRDLSVSVPNATPHPVAVFEIAEMFGFTKRPSTMSKFTPHPSWQIGFDECENPCVTVIEDAPAKP